MSDPFSSLGYLKIYYSRARICDPETGRFMQRDPAWYRDSMSLYEYVVSNPIVKLDPYGLWETTKSVNGRLMWYFYDWSPYIGKGEDILDTYLFDYLFAQYMLTIKGGCYGEHETLPKITVGKLNSIMYVRRAEDKTGPRRGGGWGGIHIGDIDLGIGAKVIVESIPQTVGCSNNKGSATTLVVKVYLITNLNLGIDIPLKYGGIDWEGSKKRACKGYLFQVSCCGCTISEKDLDDVRKMYLTECDEMGDYVAGQRRL